LKITATVSGDGNVQVRFNQYVFVQVVANGPGSVNSPPWNLSESDYIINSNNYYVLVSPEISPDVPLYSRNSGVAPTLIATPDPGAVFLNWSYEDLSTGRYHYSASTNTQYQPNIMFPVKFIAYFRSNNVLTFVPHNLVLTHWSISYNNVTYTSTGSENNTISIAISPTTTSAQFTVYPVNYTYSVFIPQNASGQGVTYSTNYYNLQITVSNIHGGETINVYFLGYYQVIVEPSGMVSPDPTANHIYSSNYYIYYSDGKYYYQNNSQQSSGISFIGFGHFQKWTVIPLLHFSSATLSNYNTTDTSIINLAGPVEIKAIYTNMTIGIAYGYSEYNYTRSYPTLVYPSGGFQAYTWIIDNTTQINTQSPSYNFIPWNSPVNYTVTIVLYGSNGGSSQLLYTYKIMVYPALSLQIYASKTTVYINPVEFTVSFTKSIPSNYTVQLDLSVFNAGIVNMTQVPGSNGYTWSCNVYLPYIPSSSGVANVKLSVYKPSNNGTGYDLIFSATLPVQYTLVS